MARRSCSIACADLLDFEMAIVVKRELKTLSFIDFVEISEVLPSFPESDMGFLINVSHIDANSPQESSANVRNACSCAEVTGVGSNEPSRNPLRGTVR